MKGAVKAIANACGSIQLRCARDWRLKPTRSLRRGIGFSRWHGRMPGSSRLVGMVAFTDTLRINSKELIEELRELVCQ